MDWTIILFIILGVFLFIKVISKLVRIIIGIGIIVAIGYFILSMDLSMVMFRIFGELY